MFENKLGVPLATLIGIAAVVPKSNGLAKLLERVEALLEAQDALQRH